MEALPLELWLSITEYCSAITICRFARSKYLYFSHIHTSRCNIVPNIAFFDSSLSLSDKLLKSCAWDYLTYFDIADVIQSAQILATKREAASQSPAHLLNAAFRSIQSPRNLRYFISSSDMTVLVGYTEALIAEIGQQLRYFDTGPLNLCTAIITRHLNAAKMFRLNLRIRSTHPGDVEALQNFVSVRLDNLRHLTLSMDSKVAITPTLRVLSNMVAPNLEYLCLNLERLFPVFNISQTFGADLINLKQALKPHKDIIDEFHIVSQSHKLADLLDGLLLTMVPKSTLENTQQWGRIAPLVLSKIGIEIWQLWLDGRSFFDIIIRMPVRLELEGVKLVYLACHPDHRTTADANEKRAKDLSVLLAASDGQSEETVTLCRDWVLSQLHTIIHSIKVHQGHFDSHGSNLVKVAYELVDREASSAHIKVLNQIIEVCGDQTQNTPSS
jgi:hypothetical protein